MSVLAPAPTRNDTPEAFLEALFTNLATHRTFPKFQFERRASDCIALFLPEIVRARYGWDAQVVAPEFPLKKADDLVTGKKNNQSTNVDYLLRVAPQGVEEPRWVLVELKTDVGSVDDEQIRVYLRTLATKRMEDLAGDVQCILKATRAKERYKQLQACLPSPAPVGQLELLYLTPDSFPVETAIEAVLEELLPEELLPAEIEHVRQRVHILTFAEICTLQVQRYPAVWELLCETLLSPLSEAAHTKA